MNLGDQIANWLRTQPGPIKSDTYDGCLAKAFDAFKARGGKAEADSFAVRLSLAGYAPQFRSHSRVWILALPENMSHV